MLDLPHAETGSKPAPGQLALIQALVNTLDVESGRDVWTDPSALARWLVDHGGAVERALQPGDLARAVAFREALRSLLVANNGGAPDPDASAVLAGLARAGRLRVHVDADGTVGWEAGGAALDDAFAKLLAVVHDAQAVGTWSRLKACRSESCRWAFYDHAKNRSGTWCTMEVCGSREKSRSYRQRLRTEGSAAG